MLKNVQQFGIILVVGALLGFFGVKMFTSNTLPDPGLSATPTEDTVALSTDNKEELRGGTFMLPAMVPENTRTGLSVLDQVASRTVQVSIVDVAVPTWLAIYEEIGGEPGAILGAQRVHPKERFTVVDLLRPEGLLAGRTYFAVLIPDNGDGAFDHKSDTPPLTPDKVTMVKFRAI